MILADNDPKVCAWLAQLVTDGHLPPSDVRCISITDMTAEDCHDTTHLFAGIGGWPLALRLAGWPDDLPVWTGSCPCQPYSSAGKGLGDDDPRNLWPDMFRLVADCRPPIVFGEQVASRLGRDWLAGVRSDLGSLGYAFGAADLCAAGVGAPHIRQRLYWGAVRMEHTTSDRHGAQAIVGGDGPRTTERGVAVSGGRCAGERLADITRPRLGHQRDGRDMGDPTPPQGCRGDQPAPAADDRGATDRLGDTSGPRPQGHGRLGLIDMAQGRDAEERHGAQAGAWDDFRIVECRDPRRGILRRRIPTEPAFQPLAHGVPARVVRLRGYGNAIVPQVAAQFVRSFVAAVGDMTTDRATRPTTKGTT